MGVKSSHKFLNLEPEKSSEEPLKGLKFSIVSLSVAGRKLFVVEGEEKNLKRKKIVRGGKKI